jgi:MinD-like ATPase involved in chromosome partitioning or flagellar assembly
VICVLVLASGAAWESDALARLTADTGIVVLKRCVDVDDLLATAATGQADAVVLGLDAPGLDPTAIAHLRRHAVRPVAVVASTTDPDVRSRTERLDIGSLVALDDLATLPESVTRADDLADTRVRDAAAAPPQAAGTSHRVVAVWGPAGAPGRTTVAMSLAAELARRRTPLLLVDADPNGGSVAQQLGIHDEVSRLLSAARLAGAGQLGDRFGSSCRAVGEHLAVMTGLPRPDRWIEVRAPYVEQVLAAGAERGHVVVDTGFGLEEEPGSDYGSRPPRNAMTLAALESAHEIVVVGAADPVGLSRLARGLVELRDHTGGAAVRVVVNRMRGSLGWSEKEIAGMVEGFARVSGLHFLPEDRAATDRALVSGRPLVEVGESALTRALAGLVDAVFPDSVPVPAAGARSRRRAPGRSRHS